MLENFQTYQLALQFYRHCKSLELPEHLESQLHRASSSIALNLAEGSGKRTIADKKRYYWIALGSLRECEAILDMEDLKEKEAFKMIDGLGAMIFTLCRPDPSDKH